MVSPDNPGGNGEKKKGKKRVIKDLKELGSAFPTKEDPHGSGALVPVVQQPTTPTAEPKEGVRTQESIEELNIPAVTFTEFRRGMRKEFTKHFHPDRNPDNRAASDLLLRVVNQIAGDKDEQLIQWKGLHGPHDRTKYYLLRHIFERVLDTSDPEGKNMVDVSRGVQISPEQIALPQTPEQFVRALNAYISGATWDEVKRQLAYIPAEIREQLRRGKGTRTASDDFAAAYRNAPGNEGLTGRFYTEFAQAQKLDELPEVINRLRAAHTDGKVQRQIMAMAAYRSVVICKQAAEEMTTLEELKNYKKEAEDFFLRGAGDGILFVGALDEVDGRAMTVITETMKRGKSEELVKVAGDIRNYPFEMGAITKDPLLASLDEKARKDLITSMQNRHNIDSLEKLKADAETFVLPSNPEASDAFRVQLLDWISRKQKIIAYRKKIGWK